MAIISIPTSVGGVALPGKLGSIASGPLSALFGSKALTTFNYPTELSTDATKAHYVQFSIKEVVPATIKDENQGANLAVPLTGVAKVSAGAVGTAVDSVVNSNPTISNLAGDITEGINSFTQKTSSVFSNILSQSELGKFTQQVGESVATGIKTTLEKGLAITPPVKKLKSVISLYMPDTLNATYSASYGEVSLRNALGNTLNSLRAIDQIAQTAAGAANGGGIDAKTGKKVFDAVSSDPNVINKVVQGTKNLLGGGDGLAEILLQGQGYAINPQMQMIYEGLPMRSFQLSFVFSPKSQQEAAIVNQIIHTFKYHAAPSLTPGATVSSQSMFLIPPSIFNVKFFIKDKENQFLPKYADCVLENIDVNFAPNGFAAHTDGAPVQTTLSLQFKEIEIVDRARLETGFKDPNNATGLR
jgi:hypothetical protein